MKVMHITIQTTSPLLGMSPASANIYQKFIAARAEKDGKTVEEVIDEYASLEETAEAGAPTVFPRNEDGVPGFFDYQIRGFFKDSCKLLRKVDSTLSSKEKAYKQAIDGNIFVEPRFIPIEFEGEMDTCERPLRASGPMGERIALACSEQIPSGATLSFDVRLFRDKDVKLVAEWLEYGSYHGLGQWRNSGKGTFEVLSCKVETVKDMAPRFKIEEEAG